MGIIKQVESDLKLAAEAAPKIEFELNQKMIDLLNGKEIEIEKLGKTWDRTMVSLNGRATKIPDDSQAIIDNLMKKHPKIENYNIPLAPQEFKVDNKRFSSRRKTL